MCRVCKGGSRSDRIYAGADGICSSCKGLRARTRLACFVLARAMAFALNQIMPAQGIPAPN